MINIESLKDELLRESKEDDIELWSVIWLVRYALNGGDYPLPENDRADPVEVRRITMELLRELLLSGQVQAGYYAADGSGIQPWHMKTEGILARVDSEWSALGREPDMGEVVVLCAVPQRDRKRCRESNGTS